MDGQTNNEPSSRESFLIDRLGWEVTVEKQKNKEGEDAFYADDTINGVSKKSKAMAIGTIIFLILSDLEEIPEEVAKFLTDFYLPGVDLE
jgi:hypothetical protein